MKKVLIIEKELSSRELLFEFLKEKKLQLFTVEDGMGALELLKKRSFDLILSDLKGIQVLDRSQRRPLNTPIVHLSRTGEPKVKNIEHILCKPFDPNCVSRLLVALLKNGHRYQAVIAESPAIKKVLSQIDKIAKSHANVFISGESGTGKEVIAGLIHEASRRKEHPFVRVNCAALSDTLIESEFFGHEKGAFTGAHQRRIGRFERADRGTLLLDEISEIPASLQAKFLRAVQEQEFERVGGTEAVHIDVRLVSTSNRQMEEAIQEKTFRADLYYRLNVIPIYLPPLRERKEDIIPLAKHFLKEVCIKNHLEGKTLSKEAERALTTYSWPGNIRELRNVIEHAAVMDYAPTIHAEHLNLQQASLGEEKLPTLQELEKEHIFRTLDHFQGNRTHAARSLGITVRTLRNKLKIY